MLKKVIALSFISTIIITSLIVIFSAFRQVNPGEVKVVTRFGQITGQVLQPGGHLIIPIVENVTPLTTKKMIYETVADTKSTNSFADYKDYPVDTNTSDGQQVVLYYTIRFSISADKATWVVQNIGSEDALVEKVVKTESRIWARNIPRQFKAEELYTGNGIIKIQDEIEDKIKPIFEANGLILDSVGVREIEFSPEYVKAIESKQIEAVKVETEKNIAEQEIYKKQQLITKAEGQAKEQELQRLTLSDEIIRKMWIEKWDGRLPTYITGDANTLLQLPAVVK